MDGMEQNLEPTVEDFEETFGLTQESEGGDEGGTPPDSEPNNEGGEQSEGNEGQQEQEPQQEQQPPEQEPQQNFGNQRANNAFAQMRVQNAQMQKSLQAMATALGIDPNTPLDQLNNILQNRALEAQAKRQNMDPQILKRLDYLESINARYEKQQTETRVAQELRAIKERFGATDEDITGYVDALLKDGYDVNAKGANLVNEFINRNFDKILQMKVDAAVKAEQERATKASSASKPDTAKGGEQNTDTEKEINTVHDLDDFFDTLK